VYQTLSQNDILHLFLALRKEAQVLQANLKHGLNSRNIAPFSLAITACLPLVFNILTITVEKTRRTVTPKYAKTPPAAETPRLRNNKIHTNRKETRVRRNTTNNSHQTNTQEDRDQSYITTGSTGRTV
jgi:hypothetical protein